MTEPARWLFVVQADHADLHDRLRRRLSGIARVILDRRRNPRRRERAVVRADQRRADRRQGPLPTGRIAPYRLVYQTDGLQVYEAQAHVPVLCPECNLLLSFEMPQAVQVPARVKLDIIHTPSSGEVQHFIDIQAATSSGRTLLACRVEAQRYTWTLADDA